MIARARSKRNTDALEDVFRETVRKDPEISPVTDLNTHSTLRIPLLLAVIVIVTLADQFTKWLVTQGLTLFETITVVPGGVWITRVHNSGIAFGLFPGMPDVFMAITVMSMFVILYFYLTVEPRTFLLSIGCAMILGGAMGNLIDRYRLGYVVDFIKVGGWPAFNVADSSVSIGVGLLLLNFLLEKKELTRDASNPV